MQLIMLLLTCANTEEAEKISRALIEQGLIACAKMVPVHALFQWRSTIDSADEILLVMESSQELCQDIEKVICSLHSYETFVLTGMPITYVSSHAKEWIYASLAVKL